MKKLLFFLSAFFFLFNVCFLSRASARKEATCRSTVYLQEDTKILVAGREITLRSGTPLVVEISQNYGGTNISEGQTVNIRVKFAVVIEKQIVIAAGALGSGVITRYQKPRSFGRPGMMEIQIQGVQTVDGQNVLLSGIPLNVEGENRKTLAIGLSVGLGLFTGVGFITGIFIKGKPAEIRGGTTVNANVASDTNVEVEDAKRRN